MLYHAEFLGEVLHKAFTDFDPDDNADALRLVLNDYKERGFNLLTSVTDPNSNSPILVFTVYQSGDDA
jgi:hypothetical protein